MKANNGLFGSCIKIKYRPSVKSLSFRLFDACVLHSDRKKGLLKQLADFQYNYRKQLSTSASWLRYIRNQVHRTSEETGFPVKEIDPTDFKGEFLKLLTQSNCPAPGCGYEPFPIFHCEHLRTCPFCFVRLRLEPIASGILELDESVLADSRIFSWARSRPFEAGLPFFNRRTGPHTWLKSHFSVQVAVPFYRRAKLKTPVVKHKRSIEYRYIPAIYHVGLHVVPADLVLPAAVERKLEAMKLDRRFDYSLVGADAKQREKLVIKSIQKVLSYTWQPFFTLDAKRVFQTVHKCFPNQNLIRFQRKRD